jgi:hypothetical protein
MLVFHRLIARRIGRDPALLDQVREVLARQPVGEEWKQLLQLDTEALRRAIVQRDERMTRLRASSPLAPLLDVRDPERRRRVWRSARRAIEAGGWPGGDNLSPRQERQAIWIEELPQEFIDALRKPYCSTEQEALDSLLDETKSEG